MISRILIAAAAIIIGTAACADDFPSKSVSIVVPYPPGGGNDNYARLIADGLSKKWEVPVVIENVPGGGGLIGMTRVSRATPDGYTLGFTSSTFIVNVASNPKMPIDPIKELQLISTPFSSQVVMLARNGLGVKTLQDLIALGSDRKIFYGTIGPGSISKVLTSALATEANLTAEAVDYVGGAEAMLDVVGNRLDLWLPSLSGAISSIKSAQVTPLFVFGNERSPLLPDVPTIGEAGFPELQATFWYGVYGQPNMSAEIIAKINNDIAEVIKDDTVVKFIEGQGTSNAWKSSDDVNDFMQKEVDLFRSRSAQ